MGRIWNALNGLLRLGHRSRWKLRGRYWRWRTETAFGDYQVSASTKLHAMLDYGQWVQDMQHFNEQTFKSADQSRPEDV